MAITDAEYERWLRNDSAQRNLLVEMDFASGTEYLSLYGKITEPSEPNPNRIYRGDLKAAIDMSQRIDGSRTFGEIEVVNTGERDSWLQRPWKGFQIRLYLGDASWLVSDYRSIGVATNGGVKDAESGRIRFEVLDGNDLLDRPILIDTTTKGQLIPLTLGEPESVKPILTNSSTLEYQVNGSAVTSIVVKDNGVTVSHTADYANGKFTLSASPAGVITANVVQATNTPKEVIEWVGTQLGITTVTADLNLLPTYNIGMYYDSDVTYTQLMDDLMSSLGGYWRINEQGELTAKQLTLPDVTADFTISKDALRFNSTTLDLIEEPSPKVSLNYARRFLAQNEDNLAGSLTDEVRDRLSRSYDTVTATNTTTDYPLAEPLEINTIIVAEADAQTEANRIGVIKSSQRERWTFVGLLPASNVTVGSTVEITARNMGWELGRKARVIGINKSITDLFVELEVWL